MAAGNPRIAEYDCSSQSVVGAVVVKRGAPPPSTEALALAPAVTVKVLSSITDVTLLAPFKLLLDIPATVSVSDIVTLSPTERL